jgi:CHAD domain-containing protein
VFEGFVADTLAAAGAPAAPAGGTLLDLARPLLADRLRKLGEAASGDLADYARLHRVRIAGKRLRYAMEVFPGCFAPFFAETLYPLVEEMQEVLGRANDSHVAAGCLAALRGRLRGGRSPAWPRWRAGVESLLRFHQRRLPEVRRRFGAWWKHWQHPDVVGLWRALLEEVASSQ